MSLADRRAALARRWLARARTDLAVASVLLQQPPDVQPWTACFHAQQAAEKSLKAILVVAGVEPPRTHDLLALAALAPASTNLRVTDADLARLSQFATDTRYVVDPPGHDDPDWVAAERAFVAAGRVLAAARDAV